MIERNLKDSPAGKKKSDLDSPDGASPFRPIDEPKARIRPRSAWIAALRSWLGPLGRYRPGLVRRDLTRGFRNCDALTWPRWARLIGATSPEERLLLSLQWEGKVVYDIGAHTGAYTLFFSRSVGPTGNVVAFEPQPHSYSKLARNLRINHVLNARAVAVAVGCGPDHRAIFMLPCMSTTASLAREANTPLRRRIGEAAVDSLDALISALHLPTPHFIKIDVEGMEGEVLEGAMQTLCNCRPDLLIEMHGLDREHKRNCAEEIVGRLSALGYRLTHAESAAAIAPGLGAEAATGHLYAHWEPA